MWIAVAFAVVTFFCMIFLWAHQFVELMRLPDSAFPGRYDKALWAAAFVIVFPIAPFAFLAWRNIVEGPASQ